MVPNFAGGSRLSQCSSYLLWLVLCNFSCTSHYNDCVTTHLKSAFNYLTWTTECIWGNFVKYHTHTHCTIWGAGLTLFIVGLIDNYTLVAIVQRNKYLKETVVIHSNTRSNRLMYYGVLYLSMLPDKFVTVMVVVHGLLKKYYLFIVRDIGHAFDTDCCWS